MASCGLQLGEFQGAPAVGKVGVIGVHNIHSSAFHSELRLSGTSGKTSHKYGAWHDKAIVRKTSEEPTKLGYECLESSTTATTTTTTTTYLYYEYHRCI